MENNYKIGQVMITEASLSSSNHPSQTVQTRSLTPEVIFGEVYTPGAISSMQDARKPRIRAATLRVTTTVTVLVPLAVHDRLFGCQRTLLQITRLLPL